jgi:hypothetical protein
MIVRELLTKLGFSVDTAKVQQYNQAASRVVVTMGDMVAATRWAVSQVWSFVTAAAGVGDMAVKTAQRVGISVAAVQELGYAADISGSSTEGLANGLKFLSRLTVDASTGGKDAVAAFTRLGVAVRGSDGQMRTTEAVFMDTAAGFAAMRDGGEKTALAIQLFGRSGTDLIPLLNAGRDGISALRAEAQRLGIVLDEQTAKAGEVLNDELTRLQTAMRGLSFDVGRTVIPTLRGLTEWLRERLIPAIRGWVESMGGAPVVFTIILNLVGALVSVALAKWAIGVATAMKGATISVSAFGSSVKALLLSTGPVALLAATFYGLYLVIEDLAYYYSGGKSILGSIMEKYAADKGPLGDLSRSLRKLVDDDIPGVGRELLKLGEAVGPALAQLAEVAKSFVSSGDAARMMIAVVHLLRVELEGLVEVLRYFTGEKGQKETEWQYKLRQRAQRVREGMIVRTASGTWTTPESAAGGIPFLKIPTTLRKPESFTDEQWTRTLAGSGLRSTGGSSVSVGEVHVHVAGQAQPMSPAQLKGAVAGGVTEGVDKAAMRRPAEGGRK